MKVGTITLHSAINYGAVLQSYALQTFIKSLDIETEIIDYYPNINIEDFCSIGYFARLKLKIKKIMNFRLLKNSIYNRIKIKKFGEFRRNYLVLSKEQYLGDMQIINNPPQYDCYIAGSDQIWNTDITNRSKAYFLDFVKNGHKISYAASIGKDELNETEKIYLKRYLASFDAISVREGLLQQKLKTEFKIDAKYVLDPVFFLDQKNWLKIANKVHLPKGYVLCYMMEYSQELINHTKIIANKLRCSALFISSSNFNFSGRKLEVLGPDEFIYSLANARYICTNSFHGIAFSLISRKNFSVVRHSQLNSRISSLVALVGLNDRFIDDINHSNKEIEYNKVTDILQKHINYSQYYIKSHVGK